MAQRTVVLFTDDLDGGPAEGTVRFALDGVTYEIDLSTGNATALRNLLAVYTAAGRRVGGRRAPTPGGGAPGGGALRSRASGPARTDPEQTGAMRAWARQRGLAVNDRGRIPHHIVEAYHNPDTAP